MQRITSIIILVAITLLGAVSCQTKPQLPSQWYSTVQITQGSDNLGASVWFIWFDSSDNDVPKAKMASISHADSEAANTMVIGNYVYQLNLNSTGGTQCFASILEKSQVSMILRAINFLTGATFQGTVTQNGQQCNLWTNNFGGQGYSVSGCFLTNGTPVSFILAGNNDSYPMNVLGFGSSFDSRVVFNLPTTGCIQGIH